MTPADAAAHRFADNLALPRLAGSDKRHLTRVLRLPPGSAVTVGDGMGRWRACRLMAGGELEPAGEVVEDQRPMPELTVAFALVKGERPELVVRALTEIGVDRIVPFTAERSVVRWEEAKAHTKLLRLAEIARQAAMQSRRSFIPRVGMALPGEASPHRVPPFAEVAALDGAALASRDGGPPSPTQQCVLVGPEGGWGAEEQQAGLPRLRLAAHVLRTETAAIAAGELLVALRAGLVAAAQGRDTNARPPRGGGRFNCPPPRQSIE